MKFDPVHQWSMFWFTLHLFLLTCTARCINWTQVSSTPGQSGLSLTCVLTNSGRILWSRILSAPVVDPNLRLIPDKVSHLRLPSFLKRLSCFSCLYKLLSVQWPSQLNHSSIRIARRSLPKLLNGTLCQVYLMIPSMKIISYVILGVFASVHE